MKKTILNFAILLLLVIGASSALRAQGSIEVTVVGVHYNTNGGTTGTLTLTITGRQGGTYGTGGTGGLFASNLRYDLQVKTIPAGGTFTLNNVSGNVNGVNSAILTGGVTNASSVPAYAPQGVSPVGTNASIGFTLTRNNASDPDLPAAIASPATLFTVTYPFTITAGSGVDSSAAGSTMALRLLTGTRGSSWSSFSSSGNSFVPGAPPLPVSLISFDARKEGNSRVALNWVTAQEINTDHFEIERSADAKSFTTVVASQHAAGTSFTRLEYISYDNAPMNGDNYYRLKTVDMGGKVQYSEIRKVTFENNSTISVVPNPVTGSSATALHINANSDDEVSYVLTDVGGRTILNGKVTVRRGANSYPLDLSAVAAGNYFLNVHGNSIRGDVKVTKVQ